MTVETRHAFTRRYLADQVGEEVELLDKLLLCAQAYVTGDLRGASSGMSEIRPETWSRLEMKSMDMQAAPVIQAVTAQLEPQGMPTDVATGLSRIVKTNRLNNQFLLRQGHRIIELLERNDIPAVPFKGPWLAWALYGELSMRVCGDIDVLVRKRDFASARDLIAKQGYHRRSTARKERQKRQTRLERFDGRVIIDLHWSIFTERFHTSVAEECMYESVREMEINGIRSRTFSLPVNLNIVCIQGSKDCWPDLGRACDAAMCLARCGEEDWNSAVSLARRLGTQRALLLGARLAHELVGAPLPGKAAAEIRNEPALDRMINEIARGFIGLPVSTLPFMSRRHWFYSKLTTSPGHRLRLAWHGLPAYLRAAFRVSDAERRMLSLPRALDFLYIFIRLGRLAGRYCRLIFRTAVSTISTKFTKSN